MKRLVLLVSLLLISSGLVAAQDSDTETPTLLVYSTIERIYAGEVEPSWPLADTQAAVETFPPDWAIVGVGTTNFAAGNGEVMVDGTVAEPHYFWADGDPENIAMLFELNAHDEPGDAEAAPAMIDEPAHEFPVLMLSLASADSALTFEGENVEDVHTWVIEQIEEAGITLAGVQVTGEFETVKTSITLDLPTTGFVVVDGRISEDIFDYIDYDAPGAWVFDGVYAAEDEAMSIISVPGHPLHLHGYDLDAAVGGHIQSAGAAHVTLTVYPLETIVQAMEGIEAANG